MKKLTKISKEHIKALDWTISYWEGYITKDPGRQFGMVKKRIARLKEIRKLIEQSMPDEEDLIGDSRYGIHEGRGDYEAQ